MSISPFIRRYISELDASFTQGTGLNPTTVPRPEVNPITLAPPAIIPVMETMS